MSGRNDTYIDTFEDTGFRDKTVGDGEVVWTRPFALKNFGVNGVQGLYIDCEGSGTLEIVYETDPGEETGEPRGRIHDWFVPSYRNPVRTAQAVKKDAIPLVVVIGKFVRFRIKPTGGSVTFNSLKLCYE